MKISTGLTIILLCSPIAALTAGDYIWENKFQQTLPAAQQGEVEAQFAVGEMFERGMGPIKNLNTALEWYRKAAFQGHKKAAYKLGIAYYEGKGVEKDYQQARSWLQKSAEQKYARAQYYLGEIFETGRGVEANHKEAAKWYQRALEGGMINATISIERITQQSSAAISDG